MIAVYIYTRLYIKQYMSQLLRFMLLLVVLISACSADAGTDMLWHFTDHTQSGLPAGLSARTMDVASADLDNDGDIDLVLAMEFDRNLILLNNGNAVFTGAVAALPANAHDSEDIGIADFDNDNDPDIIIVSEDDLINELYMNEGDAVFIESAVALPVSGISNAVAVLDINTDGAADIVIGNNGPNVILINDGSGRFADETAGRLQGANNDVTQDVLFTDVDHDGDPDLVVANEGQNRIYINLGDGVFHDETARRMPALTDESREIVAADVDDDGDTDLFFANVMFTLSTDPANRLLLNDGSGHFRDVSDSALPVDDNSNFSAEFIDINSDGYADILTGSSVIFGPGSGRVYIYLNDGAGGFEMMDSSSFVQGGIDGNVFGFEMADFNGDGLIDIYVASRQSQSGAGGMDALLLNNGRQR